LPLSLISVAGAALTGIAAATWFAERAFDWANPIAPLVEDVASHALSILVGLVVLTVAATIAENEMNPRRQGHRIRRAGEPEIAL
jgi:hypothetical protein